MHLQRAAVATVALAVSVACVLIQWRRQRRLWLACAPVPSASPPEPVSWTLQDLDALHFSADYLFAYKQHDLHLDSPAHDVTLQKQLCACYPELIDKATAFGFRNVHQLDYATSGVLCFALNKKAAGAAGKLFQRRLAQKCYLALVEGHVPWDHKTACWGIGDDASDPRGFRMALEGAAGCVSPLAASTDCFMVSRGYFRGRAVTKLLLRPRSGRRHQLRLHCLALGHAIVGDVAYTGDEQAPRMMLHAWLLQVGWSTRCSLRW